MCRRRSKHTRLIIDSFLSQLMTSSRAALFMRIEAWSAWLKWFNGWMGDRRKELKLKRFRQWCGQGSRSRKFRPQSDFKLEDSPMAWLKASNIISLITFDRHDQNSPLVSTVISFITVNPVVLGKQDLGMAIFFLQMLYGDIKRLKDLSNTKLVAEERFLYPNPFVKSDK